MKRRAQRVFRLSADERKVVAHLGFLAGCYLDGERKADLLLLIGAVRRAERIARKQKGSRP